MTAPNLGYAIETGAVQLLDYTPPAGGIDEMLDGTGAIRPAWLELARSLGTQPPEALARRFARADRYLADAGVFYRLYSLDEKGERRWPLSHIPLIIDEREWAVLAEGVVQRARFLEALAADIYGENRMVAAGLIPPQLIAASPEFLRPLVGQRPVGGRFLNFVAFDLGRGPDGRWWVLGDRAQAPSGAGFALENRVATTRAFGDISADLNVHRLAGFFRDFRDHLANLRTEPGDAVAVVSPGPLNETYFEHAYLARYLGLLLLEGEDLAVVGGKVMVRTVAGLRPVSVLWRRLDAAFMDPLELDPASRIGTPGLVNALRNGASAMINALGSGILETRALLAFMPGLGRHLVGEELSLPSIATWWCGDRAATERVAGSLDRMMIGPALSTRLALEDDATHLGSDFDPARRAAILARLNEGRAGDLVAQEAVSLSTMPADTGGRFEPRPVVLRVYAARTGDGWSVMPGGFARIGSSDDRHAISMQRGGGVADVWILSSRAVEQVTLLASTADSLDSTTVGLLTARAADNLFWLGRYVERAEALARILRAYHTRRAETVTADNPLLRFTERYLRNLGVDAAQSMPVRLTDLLTDVKATAGRVRDRFSPDGWLALRDLSKTAWRMGGIAAGDDAARAMTVLLRKLAGFSGLLHENMVRSVGWRFLEVGRRLERAGQMARLADKYAALDAPDGALDLLLEVGDSVITHRRRFAMSRSAETHLDVLVRDVENPRAVAFQLARLKAEMAQMPQNHAELEACADAMITRLPATGHPVDRRALDQLSGDLATLSDLLSRTFFH